MTIRKGANIISFTAMSMAVAVWNMLLPITVIHWCAIFIAFASAITFAYRFSRGASPKGEALLSIVGAILICGAAINIKMFCLDSGGTFEMPVFMNFDSKRLYNAALQLFNGQIVTENMPYLGVPAITAAIWKITGVSVFVPMLASVNLTLAAIAITSVIAQNVLHSDKLALLSMAICSVCCYYVGCGMLILKEPYIYFGVALILLSTAELSRHDSKRQILLFIIGTILLASCRTGVLYYFAITIPLFCNRKNWKRVSISMCILVAGIVIGNIMSSHPADLYFHASLQGGNSFDDYLQDPNHSTYNSIFSQYYTLPSWLKAVLLPITCGIQYLVPFPFDFTKYWQFGYTQSFNQFAFPWYAVGGVLLFYVFRLVISPKRTGLWQWGILACVSFAVPAFMFAGSVSRYWLPFMPLYAILISFTLHKVASGDKSTKHTFRNFYIGYIIVLIATLTTCYVLLN